MPPKTTDRPSVQAGGASVVQVETLGKGGALLLWFSSFLGALALGLSIFALILAIAASKEGRMAQYELTLMRGTLHAAGLETEDPETHEVN